MQIPLWVLMVSCTLLACQHREGNTTDKPNIVLINIDDLGWADLGYMGSKYYETPHIDALAQSGISFTQAYAGAANCAPSRACLLSGMNTPRHGVYTVSNADRGHPKTRRLVPIKNTKHLRDSLYTLPKMLQSAGYATASFGKWHVGSDPVRQGIGHNVGGSGKGNPGKGGYFSPYNIDHIADGPEGEYLTDRLTDEAIAFMEGHKDKPFFVYLPYYTVHTPLMGKAALVAKYRQKNGTDGQDNPVYAAMVEAMDDNVGRVLQALERLGLTGNTVVIFTSDNGGIRSISAQGPLRAGKGSYYEGGIRVPMAIRWPGKVPQGTVSHDRVSQLDLYPTLQEIVNPPQKARLLDGISLLPQLQGNLAGDRELYFHFPIYLQAYNPRQDDGRDPLFRTRPGSVVLSGDYKLHQYFEDGSLELYNLKKDIGERDNLADIDKAKAQELLGKLERWRQATHAPVPTTANAQYDPEFEQKKKEAIQSKPNGN